MERGRRRRRTGGATLGGARGPYDPARVLAECAAKRRIVQACRDARPEMTFLGTRSPGMADFPIAAHGQHQFAAVILALLALPYADHPFYRPEWRP